MSSNDINKTTEKISKDIESIKKTIDTLSKTEDKLKDITEDQLKLDKRLRSLFDDQNKINNGILRQLYFMQEASKTESIEQSKRFSLSIIVAIFTAAVSLVAAIASLYSVFQ